jgi:hypothetical protein
VTSSLEVEEKNEVEKKKSKGRKDTKTTGER